MLVLLCLGHFVLGENRRVVLFVGFGGNGLVFMCMNEHSVGVLFVPLFWTCFLLFLATPSSVRSFFNYMSAWVATVLSLLLDRMWVSAVCPLWILLLWHQTFIVYKSFQAMGNRPSSIILTTRSDLSLHVSQSYVCATGDTL